VNARRLLSALVDAASVALLLWIQANPDEVSKAAALRRAVGITEWSALQLFRAANRTSRMAVRLNNAYLREVA